MLTALIVFSIFQVIIGGAIFYHGTRIADLTKWQRQYNKRKKARDKTAKLPPPTAEQMRLALEEAEMAGI